MEYLLCSLINTQGKTIFSSQRDKWDRCSDQADQLSRPAKVSASGGAGSQKNGKLPSLGPLKTLPDPSSISAQQILGCAPDAG